MPEKDQLLEQYTAELERLEEVGFQIHISFRPAQAMAIVGALQLALRHPNFKGPASVVVFNFVHMLHDEFKGRAPFTAEVIRRGGLLRVAKPRARHKKGGDNAN